MIRNPFSAGIRFGLILLLIFAAAAQAEAPASEAAGQTESADESFISYQLRAGEDPSKVARMFHVTVEALLALNNISDAHRLATGASLKIPDPRATQLEELRTQKDSATRRVAEAQASARDLQQNVAQLQSQVAELRDANDTLRRDQVFYDVWRVAAFASTAAAVGLGISMLLAWRTARDEQRRCRLANKQTEVMQVAVDKYRRLTAQFELRYQSLFHPVATPSVAENGAQALRRRYDEDVARLDAIVAEAEQALKRATAELSPAPAPRTAKAPIVRLSAVHKRG